QIPNTPLIANGTLDLNGINSQQVSSLSGSGTVTDSVASASATLMIGSDNTSTTFGGSITADSGNTAILPILKTGSGSLTLGSINTLSSGNTFNGGVTINAGKIVAGHANVLGSGSNTNNQLSVTNAGNTLDLAGFNQAVYSLTGNGTIDNSSS